MGYPPIQRPNGADVRPRGIDRPTYNHNFNGQSTYHIGPYHAPRGYSYRRWSYGNILPRLYWTEQYRILEYWLFGLDVPPYDCEWVRYGPDALLIDVQNGEVIQVVYNIF